MRRALTLSFGTSGLIQALTVVTGVLLARALGVEGRGELAAVLLWPGILAAIGSIGVPDAATFHAARATTTLGKLVGSVLALGVAQSLLLAGVGAAVLPLVLGDYDPAALRVAYFALAYIPLYLLTLYLMNVLNGLQRAGAYQVLRFTVVAGNAVLLVAFALTGALELAAAAVAYLAAHLVAGVAASVLLFGRLRVRPAVDLGVCRQLLGFGLRSHLTNVSAMLNERLDQLLISIFLTASSLGLYVIAVTLTSLTILVGSSVALVALPQVSALRTDIERVAAARRFITLTAAASIAITIPLIVFAPRLIEFFFGAGFAAAGNAARVLLVASVFLSVARALGAVVTAAGRPLQAGVPELIGLFVTVVALAILLPAFGLIGAAFASLLGYGMTMVWVLRRTTRVLGVPARSLLIPQRLHVAAPAGAGG